MKIVLLGSIVAASFALTQAAAASNITYSVNDTVGAGGVTGTIVTDGATGTLSLSDFISFNLTLNDGVGTATLDSSSNGGVNLAGGDVTATPNALLFNFDGTDGGFLDFYSQADCSPPEWSFETTGSGFACNGTTGPEEGVSAVMPNGDGTYSPGAGTEVFATAGASATPEPSSLVLLGSGLAGVIGFARRRFV